MEKSNFWTEENYFILMSTIDWLCLLSRLASCYWSQFTNKCLYTALCNIWIAYLVQFLEAYSRRLEGLFGGHLLAHGGNHGEGRQFLSQVPVNQTLLSIDRNKGLPCFIFIYIFFKAPPGHSLCENLGQQKLSSDGIINIYIYIYIYIIINVIHAKKQCNANNVMKKLPVIFVISR